MSEHDIKCPIWDTPAKMILEIGKLRDIIDSPRAGGKYVIEGWVLASMKLNIQQPDDATKAHLTSWLIEQRDQGVEYPPITLETIKYAKQRRDLPIYARADRFLRYLSSLEPSVGRQFQLELQDTEYPEVLMNMQAFAESKLKGTAKGGIHEIVTFDAYLEEKGWIQKGLRFGLYQIAVEGYAHLEELERRGSDSSQAFVAMWFDPSMENAWKEGIACGIRDAGYKPFRIDRKELSNKIDDEIIAEIRRSRFIVCDVTCELIKHNDEPTAIHRGSVYYEAGFAYGLGIHVIFTCRKDVLEKIAFDTRQYPHIVWETPETLRRDLANRIAAVIGDGPLPKPQQ